MANYASLKAAIQQVIKTNGNNEITGALLQQTLFSMVGSLGAGYQFMGIALPSTNPGTPDYNVAYLAGPGTYPNFGPAEIQDGYIGVLKYNGSWSIASLPVGSDEQLEAIRKMVEQRTGEFERTITISSTNPQSLIAGINIPSGTKIKINISSSTAVWSRLALFGNSGTWGARTWTADNIQNGIEYEYVAPVDITDISIYPISVSTFGQLTITITFDPAFINGKIDKSSLVQVLGLDENNIISQKTTSQNLYRLFASVIPRDLGKNKFVPSFIETGKHFTQNGIGASSSYNAYYYIPIDGNTTYEISGFLNLTPGSTFPVGSGKVYMQFLDDNFEIINAIPGNTRSFTSPTTAKYINVSVGVTIDRVQLELGSVATAYEEPIFGNTKYQELLALINQGDPDFSIAINKLNFVKSKNLIDINANDFAVGKFIKNSSGELDSNTTYNTTNFCRVTPGEKYTFSRGDTLATTVARFILFYDANKQPIASSYTGNQTSPFTAPENAYYVRLSYSISVNPLPQLEFGETPTEYQQYKLVIPQSEIEQVAKPAVNFDSLRDSGTLAASNVLTLPIVHVQKNILLSAKIVGTISVVNVGVGYLSTSPNRGYNSRWLEITPTEIKLYGRYNDSPILYNTFTHGLTLDNKTFVSIESTIETEMNTKISLINSLGDRFTTSFTVEWGVGRAFIHNAGSGSLDVSLSMMLRDITKRVWVFGDSYISFVSNARWAYYAVEDGNIGFFSNNQPGLSPADGVTDLRNILALGYNPVYLVWMLGMNGDGVEQLVDGVYQINTYQKNNIDAVIGLCESNAIIPIFTCIPTVPSYQKTGLCNYVRSLGYRYIDVANAVGTNENGEWTTGLLSDDNVHPTAAGARVIYGQILADVPEIAIKE